MERGGCNPQRQVGEKDDRRQADPNPRRRVQRGRRRPLPQVGFGEGRPNESGRGPPSVPLICREVEPVAIPGLSAWWGWWYAECACAWVCASVRGYVCTCMYVHGKTGGGLCTTAGPRSASTGANPLPHTAQRAAGRQNRGEEGRRVTSQQGPRGSQSKMERIERQQVESSRKGNGTR